MIDPIVSITSYTNSVFTELSESINAQIDSLLAACESDSDITWLVSYFSKYLVKSFTSHSSVKGIEFKFTNEVGHWSDGKWHGYIRFEVNPQYFGYDCYHDFDTIRESFSDFNEDAFLYADETMEFIPSSFRNGKPIFLRLPKAEYIIEWIKWIIELEYKDRGIDIDDAEMIPSIEAVISEFADFIENHCQHTISEVSMEFEE